MVITLRWLLEPFQPRRVRKFTHTLMVYVFNLNHNKLSQLLIGH